MRWLALLVAACVGCAGGGTSSADSEGEWVREYDGFMPETDLYEYDVIFVRDKQTGRPIEDARVTKHPEDVLDENANWAPQWAEATTDEFGLAWFHREREQMAFHWAVHANGYAPTEEYGHVGPYDTVELERGRQRAGFLRHPDGRPAAGVVMRYKVGCAHSPDLAEAVTDKNGRFVFERIGDVDITFDDARFDSRDYWVGAERNLRWLPPTLWLDPASNIRGRVMMADGTPPEFAAVYAYSRSPRARAGARGYFVLRGVAPRPSLLVYWSHGERSGSVKVAADKCAPGHTVVIVVDAPEEKPSTHAIESRVLENVEIRVRDIKGDWPKAEAPVHLDRTSDGRRFTDKTDPYRFAVEPGQYELSAGEPGSRYYARPRLIEIKGPTPDDAPIELTVQERPRLKIVNVPAAGDPLPDDPGTGGTLIFSDHTRWVDPAHPTFLPEHARVELRVRVAKDTYTFPVAVAEHGLRVVSTRLPGGKQLRFPDLQGEYEAEVMWDDTSDLNRDGDAPTLWTAAVGTRWLVVTHPDKGRALRKITLPWESYRPIEIRDLEFEPIIMRELRVLDAAGNPIPVEDWGVEVHDDVSPPGYSWTHDAGDDTVFRSSLLHDGGWVKVVGYEFPTRFIQLRGDGPYTVRLGSAAIEIDLPGYEDGSVMYAGEVYNAHGNEPVTLTHLDAGPHTLLIGAKGCVPQIHRVILKEGETRTVKPALRKR